MSGVLPASWPARPHSSPPLSCFGRLQSIRRGPLLYTAGEHDAPGPARPAGADVLCCQLYIVMCPSCCSVASMTPPEISDTGSSVGPRVAWSRRYSLCVRPLCSSLCRRPHARLARSFLCSLIQAKVQRAPWPQTCSRRGLAADAPSVDHLRARSLDPAVNVLRGPLVHVLPVRSSLCCVQPDRRLQAPHSSPRLPGSCPSVCPYPGFWCLAGPEA